MAMKLMLHPSYLDSTTIDSLPMDARLHLPRIMLGVSDAYGCFQIRPREILGKCYPNETAWPGVTETSIMEWLDAYQAAGLLQLWSDDTRTYGYWRSWDKFNRVDSRYGRSTPEPPDYTGPSPYQRTPRGPSLRNSPHLSASFDTHAPLADNLRSGSGSQSGSGSGSEYGSEQTEKPAVAAADPSGPDASSRKPIPRVVKEAEARDRGEFYHGDTRLRPGELWAGMGTDFEGARGSVYAGGLGARGEFNQDFLPWYREVIPPYLDKGDSLESLHAEIREIWKSYMRGNKSKGPPRISNFCRAWNHYLAEFEKEAALGNRQGR